MPKLKMADVPLRAYTIEDRREHPMHQSLAFDALIEKPPAAKALALRLVVETDLLRLRVIVRLHARGLPSEISWSDLLQEAFTRVLDGSRRQPDGLPVADFLAGVMRSIKADYWRRVRRETKLWPKLLADFETIHPQGNEISDPSPSPERCLIAMQEIAAIDQLFADDNQSQQVIAGLLEGRSSNEIRTLYNMTKTDYESTRKRMRRALLREGLRCPQP